MAAPVSCWALHDGVAGHRRQALALAGALFADCREIELRARAPWSWLAPRRLPGAGRAFGEEFARMLRAPPRLGIGCARRAALATRLLRERGAAVVQVLDPRIPPRHWDLLVAPEHDGLDGPNVLTLCGSLNPVDDLWLAEARRNRPGPGTLPGPRTAVLLGGPTRAVPLGAGAVAQMFRQLSAWRRAEGGSLLLVGSRRTPPVLGAAARELAEPGPGLCWLGPGDGDNPYAAALAWADRIVCTPDSVNMVSEACATLVPVFVARPDLATGRVRRFLDGLAARGRIRPLGERPEHFVAEPLRETARIAALVRQRLGL
ncbi:mitochondrial fission ELM1 family protein [Arenimonas fontis]|uniref:Nucleoside-diphosphate sugar epimerase n=1 Tax=Arenimonas fontis TaxID=2608255 RepID=A0A5B2Z8Q6_9GAMM|nr:mitochondrial fission ELM1 family protein [Arenimonas fontis]KAA2284359.1 nucleoside-diphosphate sugar epimerase [Arenimonas fontis]